jgi:hypothetical protein
MLLCAVLQKKPSALNHCHMSIASTLKGRVLGPVLCYLPTISLFLPDCAATRRIWLQLLERPFDGSIGRLTDINVHQVRV